MHVQSDGKVRRSRAEWRAIAERFSPSGLSMGEGHRVFVSGVIFIVNTSGLVAPLPLQVDEAVGDRVNPAPARRLWDLDRLAQARRSMHYVHMKRTNLVLDEEILEEATRLSGAKTYSAAVMQALEDFVRRAKARQILELRGTGAWEGDLREMRGDPAPKRKKRAS